MADGQVEVVDSVVYLGSRIDYSGASRGKVEPAEDRYCSDLHEPPGKMYLEVKHRTRYQDTTV